MTDKEFAVTDRALLLHVEEILRDFINTQPNGSLNEAIIISSIMDWMKPFQLSLSEQRQKTLHSLHNKDGIGVNELARLCNLDKARMSRIISGKRAAPHLPK